MLCCERLLGFVRAKANSIELPTAIRSEASPRIKYSLDRRSKTISVTPGASDCHYNIAGKGTVLASLALEQDSAYWEVRVQKAGSFACGVSRALEGEALDAPLQWALEVTDTDPSTTASTPKSAAAKDEEEKSTERKPGIVIKCQAGDVIGCIFAQSEFPMLRFLKNGEELPSRYSVERVRGLVFPAMHIKEGGSCALSFFFHEDDWTYPLQSSRYPAVMESRDMI